MRPSRIKTKLRRGEPVLVTTLHLTDASIYELASLMGFDGILMDMEHHSYSLETATELMRGARVAPVFYGADIVTLKRGLERIQEEMTPLGFQFDNRVG